MKIFLRSCTGLSGRKPFIPRTSAPLTTPLYSNTRDKKMKFILSINIFAEIKFLTSSPLTITLIPVISTDHTYKQEPLISMVSHKTISTLRFRWNWRNKCNIRHTLKLKMFLSSSYIKKKEWNKSLINQYNIK